MYMYHWFWIWLDNAPFSNWVKKYMYKMQTVLCDCKSYFLLIPAILNYDCFVLFPLIINEKKFLLFSMILNSNFMPPGLSFEGIEFYTCPSVQTSVPHLVDCSWKQRHQCPMDRTHSSIFSVNSCDFEGQLFLVIFCDFGEWWVLDIFCDFRERLVLDIFCDFRERLVLDVFCDYGERLVLVISCDLNFLHLLVTLE